MGEYKRVSFAKPWSDFREILGGGSAERGLSDTVTHCIPRQSLWPYGRHTIRNLSAHTWLVKIVYVVKYIVVTRPSNFIFYLLTRRAYANP